MPYMGHQCNYFKAAPDRDRLLGQLDALSVAIVVSATMEGADSNQCIYCFIRECQKRPSHQILPSWERPMSMATWVCYSKYADWMTTLLLKKVFGFLKMHRVFRVTTDGLGQLNYTIPLV
ncbi:hypothetical protein AJ78_00936 [Emergomyces pasteurianus Ep9510]|uniref:Uncharacterized protein n=1 Tax=Emergomyces pasteurianus Ep9510 TaxID=1447872 RepID=A0A1J9PRJ4_9EURO|nr:hypothetical protein AJ78_00936 [Emergomyces pasteurianus Ep9510]